MAAKRSGCKLLMEKLHVLCRLAPWLVFTTHGKATEHARMRHAWTWLIVRFSLTRREHGWTWQPWKEKMCSSSLPECLIVCKPKTCLYNSPDLNHLNLQGGVLDQACAPLKGLRYMLALDKEFRWRRPRSARCLWSEKEEKIKVSLCCWRLNCFNGAKPSIGKYLVTTCFSCKSAFMFVAKRSQGTFCFRIWLPRQASASSLLLQLIEIRTNISWSIYKRKIRWTSDCYDFRGIKKADIIVGLVTYDANSCKVTLFPCRTNNLLLMVPSRVTKIFHCRWDDQHPAIALPSQSFRGANARTNATRQRLLDGAHSSRPGPFSCCHQLSSSQLKNPLSWQQADEYGKDEKGAWLKEAYVFDISMRFKYLETYPFEKKKGANGGPWCPAQLLWQNSQ